MIASCILTGKPISGILGSLDQVETAGDARGLRARKTLMAMPEILYALDFAALKTPALLENEIVHCRRARADDLEMLVEWRTAYSAEALFAQNNEALLERARDEISFGVSAGDIFALESAPKAGRILPMVVYNAKLSDIV